MSRKHLDWVQKGPTSADKNDRDVKVNTYRHKSFDITNL